MLTNILSNLPTKEQRQTYQNGIYKTLLHIAVDEDNEEQIYSLISKDELDVNMKGEHDGHTALVQASKLGRDHLVLLLYELGADIERYDDRDDSALLWAVYNGHNSTAEILLLLGADPYHRYYDQRDAFSWAVRQDNREILRYLLLHYPAKSMHQEDQDGKTWKTLIHSSEIQNIIDKYKIKQKMYVCTLYRDKIAFKKLGERQVLSFIFAFFEGLKPSKLIE